MSIAIWPPLAPADLLQKKEESLKRELEWIVTETHAVLGDIRHGLQDCYALLAPIDPGSTLSSSSGGGGGSPLSGLGTPSSNGEANEVYVREKVRVESLPDPNLMSLSSKLVALGHTLANARRNLAAVMGEEFDE
ncbi:37s ribosomal protein rsm22 [Colletotrichum higginsianum IMI 349063]|uniref:37s ribosomal protein rsm22 n=1 Tax=Colletotrichum higginsianum (strain IMI 349063) TaxID=759273 RepID=A0A1B7Y899_COLHI|nr:37s ribosomal protein rsm22 [Colletotrichum higginsianum IMI 349063]OBR08281.1 37s ribosomal protein rsm22 [Colletotrichum higginsianum IMI 349063]